MNKQQVITELHRELERLHGPVLIKEVRPITARIVYLCDLLDAYEWEEMQPTQKKP